LAHILFLRYLFNEIETCFSFISGVAFIQYDKFDNVLDYNETQVPPAFQGKGIAQILAKVSGDFSSALSTVEFI
jgi:predicted GNAT family acetyltransferase